MLRIGHAGSFGEEGVFFGEPFNHDVVCSADDTTIYRISKDDVIRNFPPFMIKEIKKNLEMKQTHHENLLELQKRP